MISEFDGRRKYWFGVFEMIALGPDLMSILSLSLVETKGMMILLVH